MIWMCLCGRDKKCSDNSSTGFKWTLPAISSGFRTWPSFTLSSEERIGVDSFLEHQMPSTLHQEDLLTFQRLRTWASIPANEYSFFFLIASFRSSTVSFPLILTEKSPSDCPKTKQKSLRSPADCSPLFDSSERLKSIDQVDLIVVSADGAMINNRPGEQSTDSHETQERMRAGL